MAIGNITVPDGKVWKIESVTYSNGREFNVSGSIGDEFTLFIDRHLVYSNQAVGDAVNRTPIWFPAGTYEVFSSSSGSASTAVKYAKISAIEFNLIPQ